MKADLRILLYHDICADEQERQALSCPRFSTTIRRLKRHLDALRGYGMILVNMTQWLGRQLPASKYGYAMITFDGPHRGWFAHALPLLVHERVPATFFVTAGWVGSGHAYPEARSLRWDDVRRLAAPSCAGLFDIQNHSLEHTPLVRQPGQGEQEFQSLLRREITQSSEAIARETGVRPRAFAPPQGKGQVEDLLPHLREAGMDAVRWASLPGRANGQDADALDLQICYCDISKYDMRHFAGFLGQPAVDAACPV